MCVKYIHRWTGAGGTEEEIVGVVFAVRYEYVSKQKLLSTIIIIIVMIQIPSGSLFSSPHMYIEIIISNIWVNYHLPIGQWL